MSDESRAVPGTAALPVGIGDVRRAADRLAGHAHRTPVVTSRQLDEATGGRLFLKCENLQRAGAFKFRGAFNAIGRLLESDRPPGVLTYSSGNHAQAVALASRLLGIPATIIMPSDAPAIKLEATRGYGAEVILYDRREITREELAAQVAADRGLPVIPPYDHPDVVAGQGTAALELFEDVPGVDTLVVCCGGGGLLSGCAIAARDAAPGCHIVGVEPEAGDDATRSFRTGTLQTVRDPDTIADGARTPSLGKVTFPIVLSLVDDMVTVPDEALVRAMRFAMERLKLVIEPTGALALAAAMEGRVSVEGRRVGILVSGGNVDPARWLQWITSA